MRVTLRAGANLYIYGCQISFSPKNYVVISSKDARNYESQQNYVDMQIVHLPPSIIQILQNHYL